MPETKKGAQFSEKDSEGRTIITFLHKDVDIKAKSKEMAEKAKAPKKEDELETRLAALKAKEVELAEQEAQAKQLAAREAKLKAMEADIAKREKELAEKAKK